MLTQRENKLNAKSKNSHRCGHTRDTWPVFVEMISDTLRNHYREVDFLIPSHAMSAGTTLSLSENAIWMDGYSALGPFGPQIPSQDGHNFLPALGYLVRYQELIDKTNRGEASAAELHILMNFDQEKLDFTSQMRYDCVVQTRVNSEGIRRG